MKRTKEALADLMNYEMVIGLRPLEPPRIEKEDIPNFIFCPAFEKAQGRAERSMERYNLRVEQMKERTRDSAAQIDSLDDSLEVWSSKLGKGTGWIDRQTDVDSYNRNVERHNDAVDQVRRIRERRQDAINRHDDLVLQLNDAIEEARAKFAELTEEALSEIDKDIVACLEKCVQTVTRLSENEDVDDLAAALEMCFIALKAHNSFEEHIDGNAERQEARDKIAEIDKLFLELCENTGVRNALASLFRRNLDLIEKNSLVCSQINEAVEAIDQNGLDSMTQSVQQELGTSVKTLFTYNDIIDPNQLAAIVDEMNQSVDVIETNIAKTKELSQSTQITAEEAVGAHQTAQTLLSTMRDNVELIHEDLFFKGHFACDMIDEAVIDGFYGRELRPGVTSVRGFLAEQIGEDQMETLVIEDEDRYSIGKAEAIIEESNLLRLQTQREQVDGHVENSNGLIRDVKQHIENAAQVPQRNSDKFRSSTSILYAMSCIPFFGFVFALALRNKFDSFSLAFKSSNQVYWELGTEIVEKTEKYQKINKVIVINYITALILAQAGKQLQEYRASSGLSQQGTS